MWNRFKKNKCIKALLGSEFEDIDPPDERPREPSRGYQIRMEKSPSLVKIKGNYQTKSGMFDSICIHYHAGAEQELSRKDADNMLAYLGSRGLGCIALDHDGTFYEPANMFYLRQWGSHAGPSRYNGREGLSRYAVGIEVINSGKLTLFEGQYYAWYQLDYLKYKPWVPVKVKAGQKPHRDPRIITETRGSHTLGGWDPFTEAQEEALIAFCVKHLRELPDLSVSRIFGHSEVSWPRGRKEDPGGSLSMTMEDFRAKVRSLI